MLKAETAHITGVKGITKSERCYTSVTLEKEKYKHIELETPEKDVSKSIPNKKVYEFLKLVKHNEYSVVEQLNKMPARISLLSLFLNSEPHHNTLLKVLNQAYMAYNVFVEYMNHLVGNLVVPHHISFSDDKISPEGKKSTKTLHSTVKCNDHIVAKVLIDNGSAINVMPVSTLTKLPFDIPISKTVRWWFKHLMELDKSDTSLEFLDITDNSFGGILPECISNLSTAITIFAVEGNNIVGRIPAGFGNLINLEVLVAGESQLSGSIPSVIGRLQKLKLFDVSINSISGSIPASLGNLKMLIKLSLNNNNLQGEIPSSLGKCQNLILLDLSNNNLSGPIPSQIAKLSSLSIGLSLSSNCLTGVLPLEIGNLINLSELDVSQNMLSVVIPNDLGNCVRLEVLLMRGIFFNGSIPSSLSSLRGLTNLDLSRNNLTGKIPEFLVTFGALHYLNLSYNNFEGLVPVAGVFKNLSAAFLEGNKNPLLRLSYQSILKATNGFSSANLVGTGSFGFVYKGILEENGTIIAVKVLKILIHGASRSFLAECEALKNVRHRNLVKVLTACSGVDFQGTDFKALVYEFMANGSLEDWQHPPVGMNEGEEAAKSLNFFQRLNVAVDVGCALEYLHHHCETPIVHCDLKPSNILLDDEMVGHVGDFGLAKFIPSDIQNNTSSQSSSLGFRGTIGYAPPEYGLGCNVTSYGDVYSYGILLLELFTGRRPTDEMFKENVSLHNFVKTALPNRVVEITDPTRLQQSFGGETMMNNTLNDSSQKENRLLQSLNSIFEIGIACSFELPTERMNMANVVAELCSIRDKLLPTRSLRTRAAALPNRVAEITDPTLFQQGFGGETVMNNTFNESSQKDTRLLRSLNSIFVIGIACSFELPTERMNMANVMPQNRNITRPYYLEVNPKVI
ncbi:receptor kinase-like protein Xa21 [Durio zibethinus]|uniref:non-specific serine/threonine protein kinase n=1 Tax=Durio zibethinus TaxID=66656 RepID=A0A6P5Z5U7_DURZI|nr:receptor kinase-like protein Xa21 [Durio zibethinus]